MVKSSTLLIGGALLGSSALLVALAYQAQREESEYCMHWCIDSSFEADVHPHASSAGAAAEDSFFGSIFSGLNWLLEGNKNDGRKGTEEDEEKRKKQK